MGSRTARGQRAPRHDGARRVAFRFSLQRRRPGHSTFRGSIPSPPFPLSTLRRRPRERRRMNSGPLWAATPSTYDSFIRIHPPASRRAEKVGSRDRFGQPCLLRTSMVPTDRPVPERPARLPDLNAAHRVAHGVARDPGRPGRRRRPARHGAPSGGHAPMPLGSGRRAARPAPSAPPALAGGPAGPARGPSIALKSRVSSARRSAPRPAPAAPRPGPPPRRPRPAPRSRCPAPRRASGAP